jgi:hypothetical protein
MLRCLTLIALLAAAPALAQDRAQEYSREGIVRGLCQKDGCDEFVILDKQPVAQGPDGNLYRTRVRTYHASSRGRADRGEETGFVYCSPARPAIINAPEGQPPTAYLLAPDEQAPAYALRNSTNFYTLYFAFCHGPEAGRAAARDREGTARSLDYRVALKQGRTVTLTRIEDVLGRPNG